MEDDSRKLAAGAQALGLSLSPLQLRQLQQLALELVRWNKTYNLTAVDSPDQVLTHHLLDSLSVQQDLVGERVADVGTGAGFPGLPLAIINPQRKFVLIDAAGKKLRFISHVARLLGIANVRTVHARVETLPADPLDTVVTRAFAPLPRQLEQLAPLCGPATLVVAMKGRWPPQPGSEDDAPLPQGWRLASVRRVEVPGLAAERHVLHLRFAG